MVHQVRGSRIDYKSKWTSLHSKSNTGLQENCDSKTDRCGKLFNNRTVNSEGPSQCKKVFSNLYVTRGSYPEYIQKFQDPQTTFTPIICLFNKQGIWHFSNTNTQMSRSTWKTLNILIINQACHETQAWQFNTRGHNRTTWNYSKTPSQTNKTALSHHLITVRTAAIKTLTTHITIHRHMLAKTQKRSLSEKLEATSHVVVATENNMVAFRTLKLHLPCNPKYPEIFPKNRK